MVSINDHPDIRRVFEGFHFERLDIRYTTTNQRQGKAEVSGELVILNWIPAALGGIFEHPEFGRDAFNNFRTPSSVRRT